MSCLADELPMDPPFNGRCESLGVKLADGSIMPVFCARPAGDAVGAVLMAHDIFGMRRFYELLAQRLAISGLAVFVPDFFFRQGPVPDASLATAIARRQLLDEVRTLDDLATVIAWMRKGPDYHGAIGTVGFCMGGTFVLDLCAREPDLVTASFYGFPVPQASIVKPPPRPLDLLPAMRGPILAVWGEHDEYVGMEHVHAFARRGREIGAELDVRILPDLGHSFFTVDTARNKAAEQLARDSWRDAAAFLQRHLAAVRTRS